MKKVLSIIFWSASLLVGVLINWFLFSFFLTPYYVNLTWLMRLLPVVIGNILALYFFIFFWLDDWSKPLCGGRLLAGIGLYGSSLFWFGIIVMDGAFKLHNDTLLNYVLSSVFYSIVGCSAIILKKASSVKNQLKQE